MTAPLHALVVEDSKTQALHLRTLLEVAGYDVRVAYDAEQALVACRERKPDVVISDIVMPGLSGYDLCRALKGADETHDIPVILVTSLGEPLDVARALEAGADNFVTKPYDDAQLVMRVRRTLEPSTEGAVVALGGDVFPVRSTPGQTLRVLSSALEDAAVRNRELESTRERLERANAEREAMLKVVAHELRNPLNTLALAARLAADEADFPVSGAGKGGTNDLPARVTRLVRQMVTIVDDLQDLARIDAGSLRIERVPNDLARLAREVVDKLGPSTRRHTLSLEAPASLPAVVDGDRIEQVLTNLVTNAIKYSPQGGAVRVVVEERGGRARVSVTDEGIGIPENALGQLFGRYFRAPGSDRVARGLGIGLHIARTIVELHDGSIGATSRVGEGSTFWFELPLGTR